MDGTLMPLASMDNLSSRRLRDLVISTIDVQWGRGAGESATAGAVRDPKKTR